MLFKLVHYTVMGIALLYVAEGTHLIERGKYFPSLPRLEESASDPFAWLGAAQWGVSQITQIARNNDLPVPNGDVSDLNLENVTTFAKRLEAKRDETLKSTIGYYGS